MLATFFPSIKILGNRKGVVILSYLLLLLIFLLDYLFISYHDKYLVFLIVFYMSPLVLVGECIKTTKYDGLILSFFSSLLWYIGEVIKGHISVHNVYDNIWDGFLVLLISTFFSYVLYRSKAYKTQMAIQNEKLKELNEAKNRNLGIASHDIKNPLSVINFSVDILLNEESRTRLTEEQLSLIEMIKKNSSKILALIQDQLNWSKIESGKSQIKISRSDYVKFLKDIIENFNNVKKKNIRIELNCKENYLEFEFDSPHMEEVINNLLSNAIKFSFPDSVITVNVKRTSDSVLTEIIDKGVGIAGDELQKIFKPFVRGSSHPTSGESSTGLGLSIVDKIIAGHNGEIKVKSRPDEGSNFYFTLPLTSKRAIINIKKRFSILHPINRHAHIS
jgi:signal transduction histidine kinase